MVDARRRSTNAHATTLGKVTLLKLKSKVKAKVKAKVKIGTTQSRNNRKKTRTSSSPAPRQHFDENYLDGVVEQTRLKRLSMWRRISQVLPFPTWESLLSLQLAYAAQHALKHSSRATLLAATVGMAKRYLPELGRPSPAFVAAISQANQQAQADLLHRRQAVPATAEQVKSMLEAISSPSARTCLRLLWATASRGTSILRLQTIALKWRLIDPSTVSLTFVEGKTAKSTGAYTLHIPIPPELESLWTVAILANQKHLISPRDLETVVKHLKQNGLELRSLRRGSLQAMAMSGADPKDILLFSRHLDVSGLYAYLNHGQVCPWEARKTIPMAANICPWT